jgi:hypothetical protein
MRGMLNPTLFRWGDESGLAEREKQKGREGFPCGLGPR